MGTVRELEKEIRKVKERNSRVEADKAWERSYFRRFLIVIFTYLAIALYLNAINVQNAWLSAVVPAVAFTLSTLTFPYFKRIWFRYRGIES